VGSTWRQSDILDAIDRAADALGSEPLGVHITGGTKATAATAMIWFERRLEGRHGHRLGRRSIVYRVLPE
jgi:hypothetical protein